MSKGQRGQFPLRSTIFLSHPPHLNVITVNENGDFEVW